MASDTRTRMIEATARLLQQRGFHGTSLNDILAASSAPRGSLYFHFPGGKESLVLEAMRAGIELTTAELRACLREAPEPAEGVRTFFRAAARDLAASDFGFGCPVAPIILDDPGADTALAETCRSAIVQWTQMYREAFLSAGIGATAAKSLARTVLAALEGALLMARSERDTSILEEVGDQIAAMIGHATPAPDRPAG